jgi:HlyD family secretion protein
MHRRPFDPIHPTVARGLLLLAALSWTACGGDTTYHLAGTVERTMLELAAPVSEELVELPVSLGARVEAGQTVARLDTTVAEAELAAAQAGLAAAEAAVVETKQDYDRNQRLLETRVGTQQTRDRARRLYDEALAQVAEKKARIAQAEKHLDNLALHSHASGIVDQLPFEVGERVPAGGVVAVIRSDDRPWVRVWLPARAVSQITPEARAEVEIQGLDVRPVGRIEEVASEPEYTPHFALTERETEHLVYRARIVLDDAPEDLRPGLPAHVELRLPKRSREPE